jgi:hypothetical protein
MTMNLENKQRIDVLKQKVQENEKIYLDSLRELYNETKNEEILKKIKKLEETILIEEIYEKEFIEQPQIAQVINCSFWIGGKVTKDHISRITKFKKKLKM